MILNTLQAKRDMANNNNELEKRNQAFLIYQDENGIARVNVRFEGEDVWLNVEQMMELFDASQQDVSYHIKQIYGEGEQDSERTHKKFLLVRQEGNRSVRRNMRKPRRRLLQSLRSIVRWNCYNMKVTMIVPSRNF